MTFDATASASFGARQFWLFEFTRDGVVHRYTSGAKNLTKLGQVWTRERGLSFGRIPDTTEQRRQDMPITFRLSNSFAAGFLTPSGQAETAVVIYSGFENDPDGEIISWFRGRVVVAKANDAAGTVDLVCQTEMIDYRAKGLPRVIQSSCPHDLYVSPGCNLDRSLHEISSVATTISANGLTIMVTAAALQPDGTFASGELEFGGNAELIVNHTGAEVTLDYPIPGLFEALGSGPAAVILAPGCNRSYARCEELANLDNFGGFPWTSETVFDGRRLI